MAEVLTKVGKYINGKKPLHSREEALQPTRRKAGLTSNGSEALGDKEIERDLQGEIGNGPRRGEEASETA